MLTESWHSVSERATLRRERHTQSWGAFQPVLREADYWGSGYAHLGIPGYTGNNKFFAFSKNGK